MNSLLKFILKYLFTIVFIFIEVICFVLIFSGNDYHNSKYINSSNAFTANISEKWTNLTEYTKLRSINDSLAEENGRLKDILEKYRRDNIPSIEGRGFIYSSAKVVGATVNRTKNFLTINKGLSNNVEPEMGVVGPNGLVGIVYASSDKYSSVLPIINPETKISVKLRKNDYFGSLSWDGSDIRIATMTEIPGYVDVNHGDLVVTSGLSSIFPENIPVGVVKDFYKDSSTEFYTIYVELLTDFNNINYVYIVKNLNYHEQEQFNYTADD
ncbi:MAG: rod shape-determining protein MreC [Bacteroidales bacterium]|jgi:rod shape-determining protein MreC|nr:rod shape-determining protein MreC [Bacteroidales bacterium]